MLLKASKSEEFNDRAVLFLCTKIDLLKEDEKEECLNQILKDVQQILPEVTKDAIFPFNLEGAMNAFNLGIQTADLERISQGLCKFLRDLFYFKLLRFYTKASNAMKQVINRIKARLMDAQRTEEERKETINKVKEALDSTSKDKKQIIDSLLDMIRKKLKHLTRMVEKHLISKKNVFLEKAAIIPKLDMPRGIKEVNSHVRATLDKNIGEIIAELQPEFYQAKKEIVEMINSSCKELIRSIETAEEQLFSKNLEYSSVEEEIPLSTKIVIALAAPIWIAIGVVIALPVLGIGGVIESVKKKMLMKAYKKNHIQYQKLIAEEIFNETLMKKAAIVSDSLLPPDHLVFNLSKYIDKLIEESKKFLESLESDSRPRKDREQLYTILEANATNEFVKLASYFVLELRRFKINFEEIKFIEQIGDGLYGYVWKSEYKNSIVAVKKLKGDKLKHIILDFLQEEATIM
jgi:hypothetical protein